MGQNLSLKNELGDFTGTRVGNFIVRKIQLGDSLVEHQVLDKNLGQIIIDQVTRESQVSQRGSGPEALAEVLGV